MSNPRAATGDSADDRARRLGRGIALAVYALGFVYIVGAGLFSVIRTLFFPT